MVTAGQSLAEMLVITYDKWGIRTCPCEGLPFHLRAACQSTPEMVLEPQALEVEFDHNDGIALVDGFQVSRQL